MKAIVTVIGKDKVGIIAKVSGLLSSLDVNVEDISQTILQDYFAMMMFVDVSSAKSFTSVSEKLDELGQKGWASARRIRHEDIFNAMHRI